MVKNEKQSKIFVGQCIFWLSFPNNSIAETGIWFVCLSLCNSYFYVRFPIFILPPTYKLKIECFDILITSNFLTPRSYDICNYSYNYVYVFRSHFLQYFCLDWIRGNGLTRNKRKLGILERPITFLQKFRKRFWEKCTTTVIN